MKPVGEYVLLEVGKKEVESSLILLDQYKKKERKGVVLAIGSRVGYIPDILDLIKGEWNEKKVEVGDTVYFTPSSLKETQWGLVIHQRNLLGIKKKEICT